MKNKNVSIFQVHVNHLSDFTISSMSAKLWHCVCIQRQMPLRQHQRICTNSQGWILILFQWIARSTWKKNYFQSKYRMYSNFSIFDMWKEEHSICPLGQHSRKWKSKSKSVSFQSNSQYSVAMFHCLLLFRSSQHSILQISLTFYQIGLTHAIYAYAKWYSNNFLSPNKTNKYFIY